MEGTIFVTWGSPQGLILGALAALLAMALLYLARGHAHRLLRDSAALVTHLCRRFAKAGREAGRRNRRRARGAVIQLARETVERRLSRQLERLGATLARDLASFPHLHRQLHEQIQRVDEDYRSTVEAPPTPPEWLEAIETITRLPAREDPSVRRMLEDLRATLDRACHEALLAYRAASQRRHRVLKRMQPLWRRMDRSLSSLDYTMTRLQSQTQRLDRQIDHYSTLVSSRGSVARRVASRLAPRCLLSISSLAAIGLAAVVSFHLIAAPLQAMAPAVQQLGPIAFTEVIAVSVLVLLGVSGGAFLDSVGVTQLFPEAGWADPRVRRGIAVAAGLLVAALTVTMAGLAWTRDYLIAAGTTSITWEPGILLDSQPVVRPNRPLAFEWLPALLHSLIAIGLAFAVAAVAVPLDALIRQARVLGLGAASTLGYGIALIGDVLAIAAVQIRRILATLYDLVVILPLAVERGVERARSAWHSGKERRHKDAAVRNRLCPEPPEPPAPVNQDESQAP